ncbi:MAG: DUF368 domain-containing protein [Flavobacteriaceae bacterium]
MNTFKKKKSSPSLIIFYGLIMGAINKIPGVSGGIVAIIFGFYEKLIFSFSRLDINSLIILQKEGFKSFYKHIDGKFLAFLSFGIIISFFSTSLIIGYFLKNFYAQILGFFCGMIFFSIIVIFKKISNINFYNILFILSGFIIGIAFFFISPGNEITNPFFVFFCGIVSVSGMVIPGLSGSMILLALGNYKLLLIDSVNALYHMIIKIIMGYGLENLDLENKKLVFLLLVFAIGSIIGLILFSKVLNLLIAKYKDSIMSSLVGFVSGSVGSVWPWKSENYDDNIGSLFLKLNNNLFYYPNNLNTENITILTSILLGIFIVYIIEKLNVKN